MAKILVHTDGASRGNPGPSAIAYTIVGLDDKAIEHAETIPVTTNNQAEYQAVLAAITRVAEHQPKDSEISFIGDSELVAKQLQGVYRVKDNNLRPHYEIIKSRVADLMRLGNEVSFTSVLRARNQRADQLANQALDGEL